MNQAARRSKSLWQQWNARPLYIRILMAMGVGIVTGLLLGERAIVFELPSKIILQLLGALAPPLILIAVTHVLMTTSISGKTAWRMAGLLLLNTLVAITIGLTVANVVQPGRWSKLRPKTAVQAQPVAQDGTNDKGTPSSDAHAPAQAGKAESPIDVVLQNIPKSILGPLGDRQNIIGVILIAIAFGIALRGMKERSINNVQDVVEIAYAVLLVVLHWIINLVPIGVFAIVAKVVGTEGFAPFRALGAFVLAVMLALLLQACWYLLRIRFFSWVRPREVLRGMRDALFMAFSTASSTATMPVTYSCLKEKVGISEKSASMGSLVGANFNNDGTALYEAMAALFVAQMLGLNLTMDQQLKVVLTSVVASVGAAGIPEAGLVTMTLVFTAVKLPVEYIGLLLAVDWFLDRCRTTINVLGDVNVACLLDGRKRPTPQPEVPALPSATDAATPSAVESATRSQ